MADCGVTSYVSTSLAVLLDQDLCRSPLNARPPLDNLPEAALAGVTLTVARCEIGPLERGTLEAAIRSVVHK